MPISASAFADDALAPVADDLFKLLLADVRQNLRQRAGRAAGRVFFHADGAFPRLPDRNPGPRISAALRVSQNNVFTPVE